MKKLLISLAISMIACNINEKTKQQGDNNSSVIRDTAVQLKSGNKWEADEATKKNITAMMGVINDSYYSDTSRRDQLYANLQTKVDTLVKQCTMEGPAHTALHQWLEKVLKDMKELKDDDEYRKVYAALRTDIESFYTIFK
jgi:hypothetical protein